RINVDSNEGAPCPIAPQPPRIHQATISPIPTTWPSSATALLRAVDESLGELRPRLHLPVSARRRLLAAGRGPVDRRASVDLVDRHRRLRPAARRPHLRRTRLPVPHRRPDPPLAPAAVEQAIRLDGGGG